jgi:hypothetical protein
MLLASGLDVPFVRRQVGHTDAKLTVNVYPTVVFGGLFGLAARRAFRLRKKIRDESNTYKMRLKSGEGLVRSESGGQQE